MFYIPLCTHWKHSLCVSLYFILVVSHCRYYSALGYFSFNILELLTSVHIDLPFVFVLSLLNIPWWGSTVHHIVWDGFPHHFNEWWVPIPSPEDLPNSRIGPGSPALQVNSLPTELLGKPTIIHIFMPNYYPKYLPIFNPTCVCMLSCFSCVQLCATLWAVDCQAPLSMGFSRQEYQSGLPCLPPWDLPDPGMEPEFLMSHALQVDSLSLALPGK